MKQNIHPDYHQVTVECACGNKFVTVSSFGESAVDLDGDGVAETPSELYTMLDDRGGVWSFQLYQKDGTYNLKYTISHSNLPKLKLWFMGDDNGPHCSTVPTVEDGKLVMYLSYFTGKISQLPAYRRNSPGHRLHGLQGQLESGTGLPGPGLHGGPAAGLCR